jgi:undecaprenyl-diphosphatase
MKWLESLILGIVQGITEFLPISSDGHLVVMQGLIGWWTGKKRSGEEDLFFDVMLHVGTLTAILVYYRAVGKTGAKGLLGSESVPPAYRRGAVVRVGLLAVVATLPLIPLKLFFYKKIEATFGSTVWAGGGFLVTAAVLLLTYWLQNRGEEGKGPRETTWLDALLIGIAQMFAPLPGVSRSGLTVSTALALGFSRAWAVGFSLLIAVPAILGAAGSHLLSKKAHLSALTSDRIAQTVFAAVVAGIVGYGAIIWLVKIVRSGRMWYFSVYLIVLGLAVLAASALPGGSSDAGGKNTAHGSIRSGAPGDAARPAGRALAGPLTSGTDAASRGARGRESDRLGLVLGRPLAGHP